MATPHGKSPITDGPFEWIAVSGKHHGNYFVLKSDPFDRKLAPGAESATSTRPGDPRAGPQHPQTVTAALNEESEKSHNVNTQSIAAGSAGTASLGTGILAIASDPAGAEIYVDAHVVGQTPATLHLPAGPHRIELRANGKKDWSGELQVIKESEATVHPTMDRSQQQRRDPAARVVPPALSDFAKGGRRLCLKPAEGSLPPKFGGRGTQGGICLSRPAQHLKSSTAPAPCKSKSPAQPQPQSATH